MSRIVGKAEGKKTNNEVKLSVKDTDFLLKLTLDGTFKGNEIEHANSVLQKLVKMHRILMDA